MKYVKDPKYPKYLKYPKGLYDYGIKDLNESGHIQLLPDGGCSIISSASLKPFIIPKILRHIPIDLWDELDTVWLNT